MGLAFAEVPCSTATRPPSRGCSGTGEQGDIGIGKARRLQVRRHALGRERAAAHGERGIGFHQLFVEGEESHLVGA